MARSLLVGLAVCGLVLVGASAEAGLRRGCKGGSCGVSMGGSCGVSMGGCANGSCSVPVYDKAPVQAPVQKSAAVEAPAAPVVATSTPATTVSMNGNRGVRSGRFFGRFR